MGSKSLLRQSLAMVETEIERLRRELDRLQEFKRNLLIELEGESEQTDTSLATEPAIQLDSAEPIIPREDPQTGKRIPQRDRIIRLLKMMGPLVRGEIQNMLEISHHTLNACLSDRSLFINDRRTHKWSLAKPAKQESLTETGTEQQPAKKSNSDSSSKILPSGEV